MLKLKMDLKINIFVLSFCFYLTACRQFRFDYEYYPNIDGWLKLHIIPATWENAFKRCDYEGAVLASPSSLDMKLAMTTLLKTKNRTKCPVFTGVHATFSKGDFYSIEGVSLLKMPVDWTTDEPDNVDNNEDCIVFLEDGSIADVKCADVFPYMCFKKKTKNVVMTSCGTTDQNYVLNPRNGNCYKFHGSGKTWQEAFMICSAEGGYLAIINSYDEAQHLKSIFDNNVNRVDRLSNKDILLLGVHDWGDHGVWRTIHGLKLEDAGYSVFNANQPDNATTGEFCGAMFRSNAMLDDYWCAYRAPFICEKSPDSLLDDSDTL